MTHEIHFVCTAKCENLFHEINFVCTAKIVCTGQKYSRPRCLLRNKDLVKCFYLGWYGSILQIRTNVIKACSKSWLLTCSSNTTLSLPSYTGSALKRDLNFCNVYLSLLYFWVILTKTCYLQRRAPACNFTINSPSRPQASPTHETFCC